MRKESEPSSKNSIKTLLLFCIGVGFIVLISLFYRVFTIFQEGKFHGDHTFVISLSSSQGRTEIVAFKPQEKKIIHLTSDKELSEDGLKRNLGVVVEGGIDNADASYSINKLLYQLLLHRGDASTNLSLYDIFKLWRISNGVEKGAEEKVIIEGDSSEEEIDRSIREILIDKTLSDENKTISILNSSGVPGLGRRLERALENVGGNVINVENGESIQKQTTVRYFGEVTSTVKRLESLLNVKGVTQNQQELSDIIIIIGTDKKDQQNF